MAAFGERIRELRELRNLSQGDLAERSGLSKVYLGCVERCEKAASLETIEKLGVGLGVEPLELLRFGGTLDGESSAGNKLARKVAALAQGASPEQLDHFAEIAKHFFAVTRDTADPRQQGGRRRG